MKIVTVLGARPQFIKAATLSRCFGQVGGITEVIVHTGQHYDERMSDIFFSEMQIPKPDHFLHVNSKLHGEMTARMLTGTEQILLDEKPDMVLVYGDTNSTLAGALAAVKLHIPIAHVEAGLRSFNRRMPEEINRIVTDNVSSLLFAPTTTAVENLENEGVNPATVHLVGDVMNDAVLFYKPIARKRSNILKDLSLEGTDFILVTIHRAENTNDPERLNSIFEKLQKLSVGRRIILPIHPRTKSLLKKEYASSTFSIIDPLGYFDMILLQEACRLIVTDSGGVQKEAYFNDKFCITVREETEWVELVKGGYNFLAQPLELLPTLVEDLWQKQLPAKGAGLYGDGKAADKIVSIIHNTR